MMNKDKIEKAIVELLEEIANSPCLAYDSCNDKECACPRGAAQKVLALFKSEQCQTCGWSSCDDTDVYSTACNNVWEFMDGGPEENHLKYCMYCGRIIEVSD